jgi:glycosyltransferase involved in cell wall biosynthesis
MLSKRIGIIAPSPVPFEMGGAEKLWLGLQTQINALTSHRCELIKIPTRERSFWELIDSYSQFYKTDLSHFDLVISGKYPAWMAGHPNHHIYMLHCLRGLYDTYHLMRMPWAVSATHPKIEGLIKKLEDPGTEIPEAFDRVFSLRDDASIPSSFFDFPGPLIRKIVHSLDQKAMKKAQSFAAISRTVAQRKEYFPPEASVNVVYPASSLEGLSPGPYEYFFAASRLDRAKRMDLVVQAYRKTKTDIPLKIAGTGPLEEELRAIARKDSRIILLGFVSDRDLVRFYAGARAVVFIPYQEDYGFVTVEAMKCGKPVITFADSGGVNEFVDPGETGWVCKPSVQELAKTIETVSRMGEDSLKQMGEKAKAKVESVTWEQTVRGLLKENPSAPKAPKRRAITVLSTYPIFPPRGGGQNRLFYLYREVAKKIPVEVVCIGNVNARSSRREVAPNLWETVVPKSFVHTAKEWTMEKRAGIPITDIAMIYYHEKTPAYLEAAKRALKGSEFGICAQPYTFPILANGCECPIIHDSQNCEYLLKKQMLPGNEFTRALLEKLYAVEGQACLDSRRTLVCSAEDGRQMREMYGLKSDCTVEVPNGVDLESVRFTPPAERLKNKEQLGLKKKVTALFLGSWHQPNIEAVERIFQFAGRLPEVKFLIAGSVGLFYEGKAHPANVGFLKTVDDREKSFILSVADVGLNPMNTGSGTNMKMLDYLAAGVPVVSTRVGARGLNIPDGLIDICEFEEFGQRIILPKDETRLLAGRDFVEKNFSWVVIGERLSQLLSAED